MSKQKDKQLNKDEKITSPKGAHDPRGEDKKVTSLDGAQGSVKGEDRKPTSPDGAQGPVKGEELTELEVLKKEREEYLAGWQRAKADLINYQKDEARRFGEMVGYTKEMIIGDLLIILDSFELALMAEKDNEGLERIKNQLEDTLKKHNLEKIKVSKGDTFDTTLHESIGEQEMKDVEAGKIAVVAGSGYKIGDKVVRPTRVKLAK